ncbi:MAG: hypothetical protein ACOCRK_08345 [bacterium]
MEERAMYFGNRNIYQTIRNIGGKWNDSKERPLVCLIESTEKQGLFWAIPVGNFNHRDKEGQDRIYRYMSYPNEDLRSCYYHVGKTTVKSIFFISDVIPITEKYIEKEYMGFNNKIYIIKNQNLIQALTEKLTRILTFESSRNNYFRQRITDVKNFLIGELEIKENQEQVALGKTQNTDS